MKGLWIILCGLLLGTSVFGQEYRYERNIDYREGRGNTYSKKMCLLDIASEDGAKDAPVVVWFHGGGLTGGQRAIPDELLVHGFIVVGVGYRFSPEAKTDEIVDDAAAAVSWVMDHIGTYGGSASKIYIAGHSAGGYLVNMIGLDRERLARYGKNADDLAGIIPFSGQAITHFETRRQMGIDPLQPLIDRSAPLYHVRKDAAPMLILSGDREMEMNGRYEETAYFWRMLRLTGHPDVTMYELQGYDHGGMCLPGYPLAVKFICGHEKTGN